MKVLTGLLVILSLALPSATWASNTATCNGKRGWQRDIVQRSIHRWFQGQPKPDDLLELVQAEHGIVACAAGNAKPIRLHTTRLSSGLEVDQLGAVLLANELEWGGLLPRPEEGLVGRSFRVRTGPYFGQLAETGP